MYDLFEKAALVRFGLLRGFMDLEEADAWVDAEIQAQERPHPALLEASTMARRGAIEMVRELEPLTRATPEQQVVDGILALLLRSLSADRGRAQRVARPLYDLALAGITPSRRHRGMFYFDDALDLARDGIQGTEEEVLAEMMDFLRPYAHAADAVIGPGSPPRSRT